MFGRRSGHFKHVGHFFRTLGFTHESLQCSVGLFAGNFSWMWATSVSWLARTSDGRIHRRSLCRSVLFCKRYGRIRWEEVCSKWTGLVHVHGSSEFWGLRRWFQGFVESLQEKCSDFESCAWMLGIFTQTGLVQSCNSRSFRCSCNFSWKGRRKCRQSLSTAWNLQSSSIGSNLAQRGQKYSRMDFSFGQSSKSGGLLSKVKKSRNRKCSQCFLRRRMDDIVKRFRIGRIQSSEIKRINCCHSSQDCSLVAQKARTSLKASNAKVVFGFSQCQGHRSTILRSWKSTASFKKSNAQRISRTPKNISFCQVGHWSYFSKRFFRNFHQCPIQGLGIFARKHESNGKHLSLFCRLVAKTSSHLMLRNLIVKATFDRKTF